MIDRHKQIGIDRRIRLEWLAQTSSLLLAGTSKNDIKADLLSKLKGHLSVEQSSVGRGSGEKATTILMRTWVTVPKGLECLRDAGLNLLNILPRESHIAVHWGMIMAVYPFWGAVAANVGRLLRLQGTASATQVQRRIREQFGERPTVKDAARRVMRSFHDWSVLEETTKRGIYQSSNTLEVKDKKLVSWLIEASLIAKAKHSESLKTIMQGPATFPFRLTASIIHEIKKSNRLELFRHGLDEEMVSLKKEKE